MMAGIDAELEALAVTSMAEFRTAGAKPRGAPGTGSDKGMAIKRVLLRHEMIIDAMLKNPRIMNKELAELTGFSSHWVGRVINSDAFQAKLAERKRALTDPEITKKINARLQGVAIQAIGTLQRKLDASDSAELALQALGVVGAASSFANPKEKK